MDVSLLAKDFFRLLDERIGPFDRPILFRPFPFDAGGALNFLTVGRGHNRFVTYVSWDLFGHPDQKRGLFGRYELSIICDDESWCTNVLTHIGRQSLHDLFQPGDTLDIGPWVGAACIQGVVFEEALSASLGTGDGCEPCGVLRCIGITRTELTFALSHGVPAVLTNLKRAGIYPNTVLDRSNVV